MIEMLGYFVMGWILYRLISAWVTLQQIKGAVNDVVERKMIDAAVDRQILVARMEPVEQGEYRVVLAYNNNTNKFLGQAATQDQVESMLKSKYPTMNIVVVNEKATVQAVHSAVDTKSI
jgi:cobalamin biosynthesis Mg chelatase CobN